MATYTVTPDADAQIRGIVPLTKTIDGVEETLSVNSNYTSATWEGELSVEEVDAITDANDAWVVGYNTVEGPREPDDLNDDTTQEETPTGFIPATYASLTMSLGDAEFTTVMCSVDDETLDALRATYESLGLGGLEDAGWTATEEEFFVNGTVTLEDVTE